MEGFAGVDTGGYGKRTLIPVIKLFRCYKKDLIRIINLHEKWKNKMMEILFSCS